MQLTKQERRRRLIIWVIIAFFLITIFAGIAVRI